MGVTAGIDVGLTVIAEIKGQEAPADPRDFRRK
jgi:hypothetical protein